LIAAHVFTIAIVALLHVRAAAAALSLPRHGMVFSSSSFQMIQNHHHQVA
jgi:hypothetical protein